MNKSRIIRYMAVDGIPTLADSFLEKLYVMMKKDGTLFRVFYDVDPNIYNINSFMYFFKNLAMLWVSVDEENDPVLMAWLTDIAAKRAEIHFNVFKKYWGKKYESHMDRLWNEIYNLKNHDNFVFDLIYAFTPKTNIMALGVAKKYVRPICEVPNYCWMHSEQKSIPAVLSIKERK